MRNRETKLKEKKKKYSQKQKAQKKKKNNNSSRVMADHGWMAKRRFPVKSSKHDQTLIAERRQDAGLAGRCRIGGAELGRLGIFHRLEEMIGFISRRVMIPHQQIHPLQVHGVQLGVEERAGYPLLPHLGPDLLQEF